MRVKPILGFRKIILLFIGAIFPSPEFEAMIKREKPMKARDAFKGTVYIK